MAKKTLSFVAVIPTKTWKLKCIVDLRKYINDNNKFYLGISVTAHMFRTGSGT